MTCAGSSGLSVAIVGLGPRGLSVVERLLIRLRSGYERRAVTIWAVDTVEHGSGRVWRTGQPEWLAMNATGGEVTVRSPDSHLPGGGLVEWTASGTWCGEPVGPTDYPPRRVYGAYLKDAFQRLCADVPPSVTVRPVLGEVTSLSRSAKGYVLTVDTAAAPIFAHKVVLATGHTPQELSDEQQRFAEHAGQNAECRYLAGNIAADLPLEDIPSRTTVAVRGLGLSFYDIVRSLTIGRGGRFTHARSGRVEYRPSGREPVILAGSRTGLPFLARARFSHAPDTSVRPKILTEQRLAQMRAAAFARRGTAQLDFARQVEPLLAAEAQAAYDTCAARQGLPSRLFRLDTIGNPFRGQRFSSPAAFSGRLVNLLRADVAQARQGIQASPVKAGLETLRSLRPLLPSVVDFGGLLPDSHRDFLSRFAPLSFILSAGPPDAHVAHLVALIRAGVVTVTGPGTRFGTDYRTGRFTIGSPQVAGSRRTAETLVEARVPGNDIRRTTMPLLRRMLADGLITEFVNTSPVSGEAFATGGMAITPAPCRVIGADGQVNPDIYAIGVATEKTRWFTQVGTGRPGQDSPFCREADAIAQDIVRSMATSAGGRR
ncbi:FAD/NAD(P)-binding protein [Actinocrispum sp. NPDC049592]|uniref:FAD/NAD(P)-binding protein n=1 Tax=Actinocrispum sp. NPDC049592 TaxID=3154835 RepID=UPI00343C4219